MSSSSLQIEKSSSASKPLFILKDSPPELVAAADVVPKGRKYSKEISENEPGAVRIDEVVLGMKYASLAITDDEEGTLAKVGKSNPWHIEALKIITGSEEEAHKPLSTILSKHMGLNIDTLIDVSGVTPGGHPLDTQGYIAHNDEVVVLAYRCTTSLKDWLTNLNTTHSQWEIEEDLAQGYSGFLSGLEGLCCTGEYKPRVHTGFYNNFLASAPMIQQYIDPLLQPDQPPRKLYVVGHSLGAGIATLATCYFLLEHDWTQLPQKLVSVTAGSPRAVQNSMREAVDAEMGKLRPLDKAVMCRLVRDKDIVPTVPPALLGFKHVGKLVYITDDGELLVNPNVDDANVFTEKETKALINENPEVADVIDEIQEDRDETEEEPMSSYDRLVAKIPKPFRDHMPDFYLQPLLQTFERDYGKKEEEEEEEVETPAPAEEVQDKSTSKSKKFIKKIFSKKKKKEVDPATVAAD